MPEMQAFYDAALPRLADAMVSCTASGLTDDEISRIGFDSRCPHWVPLDTALLAAVGELIADGSSPSRPRTHCPNTLTHNNFST